MIRLLHSLRRDGLVQTLWTIYRRVSLWAFPLRPAIHPFDLRHGVDTSGLIPGRKLRSGHPHDRANTAYWGTAPSLFRGLIAQWQQTLQETPHSLSEYTLIDIGCGKGRVLMLASEFPFRRIVGLELNPDLARIAQANLALWTTAPHACNDIEALQLDALDFTLPDRPVLLYLFHPFEVRVLRPFLERLQTSAAGRAYPIDIAYAHLRAPELLDRMPGCKLLWAGEVPFNSEDAAADVFEGKSVDCRLHRLGGNKCSV